MPAKDARPAAASISHHHHPLPDLPRIRVRSNAIINRVQMLPRPMKSSIKRKLIRSNQTLRTPVAVDWPVQSKVLQEEEEEEEEGQHQLTWARGEKQKLQNSKKRRISFFFC